ncbi:MAG: hypothetical protein JST42_29835 [Bacteroidetes bacterium]|nr:hypothetical protein [Bacteroidota bacterium]
MKLIVCLGLLLTGMSMGGRAQSLKNTSWRMFVDQLHDSLTIHIGTDSSFVTSSDGSVVVRSVCKLSGDTVSLTDYDGQYACLDMKGTYKIGMVSDELGFTLIDDPCEGRVGTLNNSKWRKVAEK